MSVLSQRDSRVFTKMAATALAFTLAAMVPSYAMPGMPASSAPPVLSLQRLGYGVEMMGALGDTHRFGFHWALQQHYVGAVFTYALSPRWSLTVEPAFGLSAVSDPFILRMGIGRSIEHAVHRLAHRS